MTAHYSKSLKRFATYVDKTYIKVKSSAVFKTLVTVKVRQAVNYRLP